MNSNQIGYFAILITVVLLMLMAQCDFGGPGNYDPRPNSY